MPFYNTRNFPPLPNFDTEVFAFSKLENIAGKLQDNGHQYFSPFLTVFSKASTTGSLKLVTVWLKI